MTEKRETTRTTALQIAYANNLQRLLNLIDDNSVGELHAIGATAILNLKNWLNTAFYNTELCALEKINTVERR